MIYSPTMPEGIDYKPTSPFLALAWAAYWQENHAANKTSKEAVTEAVSSI
jgi:hypothetical protein